MPILTSPGGSGGAAGGGAFAQQQKIGPIGSNQATFDFTAIPGTGGSLVIYGQLLDTFASGHAQVTLNNDSGANYRYEQITAIGASLTAAETNGGTRFNANIAGSGGNIAGGFSLLIPNYAGTTFRKACLIDTWDDEGVGNFSTYRLAGSWANTAAVNRVTLTASTTFVTGSYAVLYIVT